MTCDVVEFQDLVGEGSNKVGVRDFYARHFVQHTFVLTLFNLLKLENLCFSQVDSNEVYKLFVVFRVSVNALNFGLITHDILLDGVFRLKETFKSRLAQSHLIQFRLSLLLLLLALDNGALDLLVRVKRVEHASRIKLFASDPDPHLSEGILPLINVVDDFCRHFTG